ncbi:threonine--tRNA ligase, putative [Entamoeba histolytica HM-1:IMSS-B]|nr:threonine--tRNA ligase, putative [Entamoeba histolytica HM-1:IMSS-B]
MVIGPVIDEGFYYDISFERPFTLDDLSAIETRMRELIDKDYDVIKKMTPRAEVIEVFKARGEEYKLRLIDDMPEEQAMGLYYHEEYVDMCRGPHVPNTRFLKAFKLTKLSGAYWRGDAKNEQLQRIYGTAWADKKQLAAYIQRIEEAEKRDHRRIGKQLDLFHLQEEAPGMVFWHANGWTVYQVLEQYMRKVQREHGYQEIKTPQVVDRILWERSGHWSNYAENMFTTASENRDFAVKPMNCPCHVQVFNQGLKSYRDLPLRLAEFGACHRNEPSGALHGIMRVRGFTQDDAHIFCTEEQVEKEAADFIKLTLQVYADFGFTDVIMKLSTRPAKRVGSEELWDRAEKALADALDASGLEWEYQPGEGAFYGPKIEFTLKDCLGPAHASGFPAWPARFGVITIKQRDMRQDKRAAPRAPINENITAREVRLIGADGQQVGIVSIQEALQAAEDAKLDLVEITADAVPPVCRIMDYGKHVFEKKKQVAAAKKNQKQAQVKEIKFRPGTEEGDYQVKLRNLVRFLTEGDKAKVSLRFRGREMAHQELGMELLKRVEADLAEHGAVEQHPKMEGRQLIMVIAPKKKK